MDERRYSRQIRLKGFGREGQERLWQARVLIVGAGGLGTPAAQYLNAMGAGTIGIVDGDLVEESNLHRQTLYDPRDVGKPKARQLAGKLKKQNPQTEIRSYVQYFTPANALELTAGYDLLIDATDNIGSRYLINDACLIAGIPFIYGAISGYEAHISVFNLNEGPTYRCLFPQPEDEVHIPDCKEEGVLGIVPAITGSWQALEAVKIICQLGAPLSGELLIINTLDHSHFKMKFQVNAENRKIKRLRENYTTPDCATSLRSISSNTLQKWMAEKRELLIADLREAEEIRDSGSDIGMALSPAEIRKALDTGPNAPLVLVCQRGIRSRALGLELARQFPGATIYNLEKGMEEWRALMAGKGIQIPSK